MLAIATLAVPSATQAQTYTFSTLYTFKDNGTDPQNSTSPVIVDASGMFNGIGLGGRFGFGVVFKVTPAGKLTVLHSFKGGTSDGDTPFTGLARDAKGNLYGTTSAGGRHSLGTVFKIAPSGRETILHSFDGTDGDGPNGVTLDSEGNIYGTTPFGGGNNEGVAFEIDTGGRFSILHTFCSLSECADGDEPIGNLLSTLPAISMAQPGTLLATVQFSSSRPRASRPCCTLLTGLMATIRTPNARLHGQSVWDDPCRWHSPVRRNLVQAAQERWRPDHLVQFLRRIPMQRRQNDPRSHSYGQFRQRLRRRNGSAGNTGPVVWEFSAAGKESHWGTFPRNVISMAGLVIDSAGNLYGTTIAAAKMSGGQYSSSPF